MPESSAASSKPHRSWLQSLLAPDFPSRMRWLMDEECGDLTARPCPVTLLPPPGPQLPSQTIFRLAGTWGTGSLGPLSRQDSSFETNAGAESWRPSQEGGGASFRDLCFLKAPYIWH